MTRFINNEAFLLIIFYTSRPYNVLPET